MMMMESELVPEFYFCEKCQRKHKKGSNPFNACWESHKKDIQRAVDERIAEFKATPPAPKTPFREAPTALSQSTPATPSGGTGGNGKAGVVAKKWDDPSIAGDNWLKGNKEDILKDIDAAHKKVSEYGRIHTSEVSEKTKAEFNNAVKAPHDMKVVVFEEKVANYRAERWEYFRVTSNREPREATSTFAYFSPAEMLQFAKRIAIAQGKKWHWWNEKKRLKECKKMGIDPVNREGQGDA